MFSFQKFCGTVVGLWLATQQCQAIQADGANGANGGTFCESDARFRVETVAGFPLAVAVCASGVSTSSSKGSLTDAECQSRCRECDCASFDGADEYRLCMNQLSDSCSFQKGAIRTLRTFSGCGNNQAGYAINTYCGEYAVSIFGDEMLQSLFRFRISKKPLSKRFGAPKGFGQAAGSFSAQNNVSAWKLSPVLTDMVLEAYGSLGSIDFPTCSGSSFMKLGTGTVIGVMEKSQSLCTDFTSSVSRSQKLGKAMYTITPGFQKMSCNLKLNAFFKNGPSKFPAHIIDFNHSPDSFSDIAVGNSTRNNRKLPFIFPAHVKATTTARTDDCVITELEEDEIQYLELMGIHVFQNKTVRLPKGLIDPSWCL